MMGRAGLGVQGGEVWGRSEGGRRDSELQVREARRHVFMSPWDRVAEADADVPGALRLTRGVHMHGCMCVGVF